MMNTNFGKQSHFDNEKHKVRNYFSVSRNPILFIAAVTVSPLLLTAALRIMGL